MITRREAVGGLLAAAAAAPARAAGAVVTIDQMKFAPATLTVRVGEMVTFVNKDIFQHTATVKGVFDLDLKAGKSGTVKISKAGTYAYVCRYHPGMKGVIVAR